jgi:hypothetical protein
MAGIDSREIQELINIAISEGKNIEEVEKQLGMSFICGGQGVNKYK